MSDALCAKDRPTLANDEFVVATLSDQSSEERPGRSLAEQLVEQGRVAGRNLIGSGRLLRISSSRSSRPGSKSRWTSISPGRITPWRAATVAPRATEHVEDGDQGSPGQLA